MIVACTGHRPERTGGYGAAAFKRLYQVAFDWFETRDREGMHAISGMALGWDQAFARAAWTWGVPFTAAVPFEGQERKWPSESQKAYRFLLSKAAEVKIVCAGGYSNSKFHTRNRWMVDNCDLLVAMWDGEPRGGTYSCLQYAKSVGRHVVDLGGRWKTAR